jgi:hypothetical protein
MQPALRRGRYSRRPTATGPLPPVSSRCGPSSSTFWERSSCSDESLSRARARLPPAPAIPSACPGVLQVMCYTTAAPLTTPRPRPARPHRHHRRGSSRAGRGPKVEGRTKRKGVPVCSEERNDPPGKPVAFADVNISVSCNGLASCRWARPGHCMPSAAVRRNASTRWRPVALRHARLRTQSHHSPAARTQEPDVPP